MAQKISEMSMEEIFNRYGILMSRISILDALDKENEFKNQEKISDLLSELYPISAFSEHITIAPEGGILRHVQFEKICEIMSKYQDIFGKDNYIYELYRSMLNTKIYTDINGNLINAANGIPYDTQMVSVIATKSKENERLQLQSELKKYLRGVDIINSFYDIEINNATYEANIKTSQHYIGNSKAVIEKNKKCKKRFEEIDKKIGISELLFYLTPSDIHDICRYPVLGIELQQKILSMPIAGNEIVGQYYDVTTGTMKEVEYTEFKEIINEQGKKGKWYDVNNFAKVLKPNLQYMNPDKLLTIALENYYTSIINKVDSIDYAQVLKLKEFYDKIKPLIENKDIVFKRNKDIYPGPTSFKELERKVNELVSSYVNCKKCSKEEIAKIREDILTGKKDFNSISLLDYSYAMKFNADELFLIVSNNPNALDYYLTNGLVDKQAAKNFIENCEALTPNQVLALYKNQLLGKDEVVGLYQESKISLECIKVLKDNSEKPEELEDIVSVQTFVELCTDSERKEEFERYRQLFKFLKIDEKTIEEKNALGMEILDSSEELLEEQKMFELYQKGIITCDTLIDLGGMTFEELYANGELKPNDARRLLDKEVQLKDGTRLNIESLVENENSEIESFRKILSKMSDEEKMVAIFSTFPGANYKKLRNQLLSGLAEVESSKYDNKDTPTLYRHSEDDVKTKDNGKTSGKGNENVTDPCARWNFISKLDEDYSQNLLKDGTLVVYLPSQQKYIIEKLFDLNHEPAYGAATYVVSEDIFDKQKLDIIQDGKVNRSKLVELNRVNMAKKIVHRGWGKAMCKVFGVNNPNLYTPKQRQELEELALEVEKSKEPREK